MFPFVQLQFDLICDDLGRHTLANAVAASAAYPLVFPALTFINKRVTGVPCARADHYDDIETLVRENRATVETLQSEWILAKSTLDQWNTKVRESQEQIQQGVLELANSKQYAEDLRTNWIVWRKDASILQKSKSIDISIYLSCQAV